MAKIAVLGAGWGGLSILSDLTVRGFEVNLWNHRPERIQPIVEKRHVDILDSKGEFSVELRPETKVSTNMKEVVEGCSILFSTVPAFAQRNVTMELAPYLMDGQLLIFLPGSCGSLEAAHVLHNIGVEKDIILAEGLSLPQSGRVIAPGKIRAASTLIRDKKSREKAERFAVFPAKRTGEALQMLEGIYRFRKSKNVLEVGLLNVNFLIHPGPYVLNIVTIERTNGDISLLNEGMSPSVLKIMDKMDAEKLELCNKLRVEPVPCDDLYWEFSHGPVYRWPKNPMGFRDKIPDIRTSRYITEDVPYGSVMWSSFGDMVDVDTPVTDAIIKLASVIQDVDYMREGRTTDKLGVSGMTVDELERYLHEGVR